MSIRRVPADAVEAEAVAAALAAASVVEHSSPSVISLGRHLAAVEVAYNHFDEASVASFQEDQRSPYATDLDLLSDRAEALRSMIATMPAKSVQDAAVIVSLACTVAGRNGADGSMEDGASLAFNKIERMLLGALPLIAEAAGLDMTRMAWNDDDGLRVRRYRGVGVQS